MNSKLNQITNFSGNDFTAYQGIVINNNYTWASKNGHVATVHIRFNSPASISGMNFNLRMIQLPSGLYPANSAYPMMFETWGTGTGTQCFFTGPDFQYGGHIRPVERMKPNTDYTIMYTYVTLD